MLKLSLLLALLSTVTIARSLVVYTSDSLAGQGSWGAVLKTLYEKKFPGKKLELVTFPSMGEAINQIVLEGKKTKADVILGVDNSMYPKISDRGLLETLPAELAVNLELPIRDGVLVPFDYGYLAVVYDSRRRPAQKPVISLKDLSTDAAFRKKLAVVDPRTSSLGASFLRYTHKVLSDSEFKGFWSVMEKQLFRLPPSWTSAYGLFSNGDVDFTLSYTTSPAYHLIQEKKDHVRAILFEEGQFLQWEGVAILKQAQEKSQAIAFLKIALSEEAQKAIPTTNWMYPVRKNVPVPSEYAKLPKPIKVIQSDDKDDANYQRILESWERAYIGRKG